ncbi:MAG: hypothetical protein HC804_00695 [Anaerolineae bacterium]|nr:hypothetical protein [Anaerolineae bacterium]
MDGMVANWTKPGSPMSGMEVPVGSRFYLPDLPTASQWIDNPNSMGLYGDVDNDEGLDDITRGLYQMAQVKREPICLYVQARDGLGFWPFPGLRHNSLLRGMRARTAL